MKHTDIDVAAVARMAKLELTAEETEHYHGELCSLVDFCSALSVFDGEKSTARSVFIPLEQLRADKPLEDGGSAKQQGGEYITLPFKTVSDEV